METFIPKGRLAVFLLTLLVVCPSGAAFLSQVCDLLAPLKAENVQCSLSKKTEDFDVSPIKGPVP